MKKVIAFGTFDLVHLGHVHMLKQAKALGDHLTVVVSRDARAGEVKGRRPRHTEEERRLLVSHLNMVDEAVLGETDDVYKVIERYNPDIIALGYDQTKFVETLEEELALRGVRAEIIRLQPHGPERYKGGLIRRDVQEH